MAEKMESKHVQISFDDLNRIRILEAEQFKETQQLCDECNNFTEKIAAFQTTVRNLTEILQAQSAKIEQQKLLAIGQRNKIESETEARKRMQNELTYLIAQKKAEQQRVQDEYDSLMRVEQEQRALIDKLTKAQM